MTFNKRYKLLFMMILATGMTAIASFRYAGVLALLGVTLVMAGVYRGMVDDGKALLDNSGADLWVVQRDTLGPYAESSSINDDLYRGIRAMPGVAEAANITYLTMQVRKGQQDVRSMVVGVASDVLISR
jgi:putative ABC transport system permease protein